MSLRPAWTMLGIPGHTFVLQMEMLPPTNALWVPSPPPPPGPVKPPADGLAHQIQDWIRTCLRSSCQPVLPLVSL